MTIAEVQLWGRTIGVVSVQAGAMTAAFEYVPEFLGSGLELSPPHMPLQPRIYSFPELAQPAFHGLPGLPADSPPDRFGNALIDQWLAMQGRTPQSFNAVERLCYTGATRWMSRRWGDCPPTVSEGSGRARRETENARWVNVVLSNLKRSLDGKWVLTR